MSKITQIISDFSVYSPLLHIRTKEAEIVPFRFNGPQWRYHLFREKVRLSPHPLRIIILKYRQGGFTTYEQAHSFWLTATRKNQEIITVAHTDDSVTKIFEMVTRFYKNLDEDFRPSRDRGESTKKISFPKLNSNFYVGASGSDIIGVTTNKAHLSEFARWKLDPEKQLSKLQETVPLGGEIVIESTPNGFNYFEELYTEAKKGKNSYFPFFIRWFDDPQYAMALEPGENLEPFSTDEEALILNYWLTPEQIKFRRFKIGEKNNNISNFWEEYPEDDLNCFLSTGKGYFDTKKIIAEGRPFADGCPPIFEDESLGIKIWEEPDGNQEYIISGDPAEGLEEDRSGSYIIHAHTGKMVGRIWSDKITPREFAFQIAKYSNRYNRAYVIVARNNHGHSVISHLMNDHNIRNPRDLFYHEDYIDQLKPKKYQIRKKKNKANYLPGFPEKKNTKPLLLDTYKDLIEETPQLILDHDLFDEIKTFKRRVDGSLGADRPKHDDLVTAHALAHWARVSGRPKRNFTKAYKPYTSEDLARTQEDEPEDG